jgi:cardiolipin synthase
MPMESQGRTRGAVRRGVEKGRRAAHRVRSWSATIHGRLIIVGAGLATLVILLFALIGLPHVFRGPTVHSWIGEVAAGTEARVRAVESATGVRLAPGTNAEVMADGDAFFRRLWADLRAAEHTIAIVAYYWGGGAVLDTTTRILAERARAGIATHVVYDAFGAGDVPPAYFDSLRAAGVRLEQFRPLRWFSLDRATHRTHVRAVVIDGRVGYTGGFGLDDKWLGDGSSPGHWRETNVRFTGPAVTQLEAAFIAHWAEAAGELIVGTDGGPLRAAPAGAGQLPLAGVIHSPAGVGSSRAERLLALSVAVARHRLWITNAYFVPDDDYVRMLTGAAARGVDVRVLTNGGGTDVKSTWYAGRFRYRQLLEGGVRIFEFQPTVLHAKTLLADDAWVGLGTVNFDNRSLAYNDEVAFLALDSGLAMRMDSLFRADAARSREITLDEFRRRPRLQRLLEWASSLVAALL